jgi:hypothetical protein
MSLPTLECRRRVVSRVMTSEPHPVVVTTGSAPPKVTLFERKVDLTFALEATVFAVSAAMPRRPDRRIGDRSNKRRCGAEGTIAALPRQATSEHSQLLATLHNEHNHSGLDAAKANEQCPAEGAGVGRGGT